MKCIHCLVEFHAKEGITILGEDADGGWAISRFDCPACNKMNLFLVNAEILRGGPASPHVGERISTVPIRPKGSSRPPCPSEVPPSIAEDYTEACIVLFDSPKASAALSRRCLQNLLREAAGVKPRNLADEIQQVIDSGSFRLILLKSSTRFAK